MNDELISIREASRRLGVSDTAVHKAIKAGRVALGAPDPKNGRPRLPWPATEAAWHANSDPMKRSHVGPQGSPRRAGEKPRVKLSTSGQGGQGNGGPGPDDDDQAAQGGGGSKGGSGPGYAQSRAVREAYMAKLAKLEYEQKSGKLVDAQEQFRAGAKLGSTLLAGLYNMPERLADDFAGMSNPHEIATLWTKEIDILVQDLRRAYGC